MPTIKHIRPGEFVVISDPIVTHTAVRPSIPLHSRPQPVATLTHSTWWPVDLEQVSDDTEQPTHLTRTDGAHLIYAGRINGIIGPSSSGKTWLALELCRQTLQAGHRVVYLDFEDSPQGIKSRLTALGVDKRCLIEQLRYVRPEESLDELRRYELATSLQDLTAPDVIVLDGFNAAMTLFSLDLMSNKDVAHFYQDVLSLLNFAPAVVYLDHTVKNTSEGQGKGGIGAQQKRALTSGATIRCDITEPFGRGQTGTIRMTVDKDREGGVLAHAAGGRLGVAVLASDDLTGAVTIRIEPPTVSAPADAPVDRLAGIKQLVCDHLAAEPGATLRNIRAHVAGSAESIASAVESLIAEGRVTRAGTRHAGFTHSMSTPYPPLGGSRF